MIQCSNVKDTAIDQLYKKCKDKTATV